MILFFFFFFLHQKFDAANELKFTIFLNVERNFWIFGQIKFEDFSSVNEIN